MSVLVKGMKMPKSCKTCDLLQDYDGCMYCPFGDCPVFGDIEYVPNHVASDICPLVELPEKHGDLIDRDALKKDYKMGKDCDTCETDWKSCQYDIVYSKMDFCGWLDDAPVVIEAEGEE